MFEIWQYQYFYWLEQTTAKTVEEFKTVETEMKNKPYAYFTNEKALAFKSGFQAAILMEQRHADSESNREKHHSNSSTHV